MAENLTLDQKNALSELRRLLKDQIPKEMYNNKILLTKFLIARDFDIKQAEAMIRKNVRWKKEMQIDTILTDFKPSEVLVKYSKATFLGYDKEGYVIRYIPMGNSDIKGLLKSTNTIDWLKYTYQACEEDIKMQESQSKKLGKSITKSVNIYDTANMSISQITNKQFIQLLFKNTQYVQDNYPEFVKKLYVINVSTTATILFNMVKPYIAPALLDKISIHGQEGWKEELLKTIDADVLPAFLGGNRKDPDGNPMCLTFVNHFGPIPSKYFLEKNVEQFAQKPGVKLAKIDRKSQFSVPIEIKESQSIINWEFELECHDIGFGLFLEKSDSSVDELIPVHKVETELHPDVGMFRCKYTGKHVIIFDNSHSWLHSKKVYYKTWVTNTEDN